MLKIMKSADYEKLHTNLMKARIGEACNGAWLDAYEKALTNALSSGAISFEAWSSIIADQMTIGDKLAKERCKILHEGNEAE